MNPQEFGVPYVEDFAEECKQESKARGDPLSQASMKEITAEVCLTDEIPLILILPFRFAIEGNAFH